jgi:hypothetical protein
VTRNQRQWHQYRMRIKRVEAKLEPADVRSLLATLCVELGFCLQPTEIERLATSPPGDSDEFVGAVLVADGYGVSNSDPLYHQVRELVADAFTRCKLRTDC